MGFIKGHIDRSTGRNKRDKCTQRDSKPASPRRQIGTGKIEDRAASARKMRAERQLRAKARRK